MKQIILIIISLLPFISCKPQVESKNKHLIEKGNVTFNLDTTNWVTQSHTEVSQYFENTMHQKVPFNESQFIGVYTTEKSPALNYPFIMITSTQSESTPPSMDQLAKELNATTINMEDFESNKSFQDVIIDLDFSRPILIKEKKLVLMETKSLTQSFEDLITKQAIFFEGKKMVMVQLSFMKGKKGNAEKDFNKIIDSMKI